MRPTFKKLLNDRLFLKFSKAGKSFTLYTIFSVLSNGVQVHKIFGISGPFGGKGYFTDLCFGPCVTGLRREEVISVHRQVIIPRGASCLLSAQDHYILRTDPVTAETIIGKRIPLI